MLLPRTPGDLRFGCFKSQDPQQYRTYGNCAIGDIKDGPHTKIKKIDHVSNPQAIDKIA